MLGTLSSVPALTPGLLAQSAGAMAAPVAILLLTVLAGIATIMLLPARREKMVTGLGGALLITAGVVLMLVIVHAEFAKGLHLADVYFWIFSAIALAGAIRVITHPQPVYSALYFVLTVFASAGLFVLLWAPFMAAALVLIYAGAILITYVFVIMLASQATAEASGTTTAAMRMTKYDAVSREPLLAATVGFTLMGVLLFVIYDKAQGLTGPVNRVGNVAGAPVREFDPAITPSTTSSQRLGMYLFQNQMVNLELAGLLLTVSMVGAILIARRRVHVAEPIARGPAEMVTAKATPITDDPFSIPVYGTENPRQKAYPET